MSRFHKVRKATEKDIFFIRSLELDPANTMVHGWDEDTHRANIADPHYHYLIAEDVEHTALGFAILCDDKPGWIEWRRIVVARRGDGIGTDFMQAVIDRFTEAGTDSIWLDVYETNDRARHVYGSLGFEEVRREALAEDPSVTLVIMERALD